MSNDTKAIRSGMEKLDIKRLETLMNEFKNLHWTDIVPQNPNGWPETQRFLLSVMEICLEYVRETNDRKSKILEFQHPTELKEQFDFSIPNDPKDLGTLLKDCEATLRNQVKTGHPRFFNQISCGLDLVSLAGEWLTAVANTNMFTYEIAPVFILMEKEVMKKMWELIGWGEGEGDGIFAPESLLSERSCGDIWNRDGQLLPHSRGLQASDDPGSSGTEDPRGKASRDDTHITSWVSDRKSFPGSLDLCPFFVCATAGTTVYGSFDPIDQIADICDKYKIWLHVDAAWGGGLLLSQKHRHLLAGIERAESVTWNPHKLMGALLQCSACLIKQDGLLFQTNQMSADYLFMQDKGSSINYPYDCSYDTGDKAIQCGRHNDIFKLWLMWRSKGMTGYEKQINRLMELSAYFTARIRDTPGYELVLDTIAPKIKAKMMSSGTTMVGYQPDRGLPNFFRMVISNPAITREDLDFLIEQIVSFGKDL